MWNLSLPWWEFILRCAIIYVFLMVLLRITGKRQVGHLTPFDMVLLLVLSNAVQNSMNGGDNSVLAGIIMAATLIALNYIVSFITYKSKFFEGLIEGRPLIVVHNGCIVEKSMKKAKLTQHELMSALRDQGCSDIKEVKFAVLENSGDISVKFFGK